MARLGSQGLSTMFGWTVAQRRAADRALDARRDTETLLSRTTERGRMARAVLRWLGELHGGDVLVELPRGRGCRWRITYFPAHWGRPQPITLARREPDLDAARVVVLAFLDEVSREGVLEALVREKRSKKVC